MTGMKTGSTTMYHSPLRQAQSAATSQRILEAVGEVLERGEEPTCALVARAAGCQERTVYRHFPTREDLAAAFWDWQYSILGPRDWSLGTEAQLLALIDRSFRAFDKHPELIKAMLHTRHGRAARLSENDQRQAMA